VLRFNTIDFIDKSENFLDFDLFVTNEGYKNSGEAFVPVVYHLLTTPNYRNTAYLKLEYYKLIIPFDNYHGYVVLTNYTIKFDKYRLYSNCNFDTIKTCTTYFENETLLLDKKD
jgi:hypothetical protein